MAVPVVAGDFVEVKSFCSVNNQVGINVFHLLVGLVTGVTTTYTSVANTFTASLQPVLQGFCPADVTIWGCVARRIRPLPVSVQEANTMGSVMGTHVGGPLPTSTSGLITWRTNVSGRAGRGRMYPPFPSNDFADVDGKATPAIVPALNGIANAIIGVGVVPGNVGDQALVSLILYHRATFSGVNIGGFTSRQLFATQRRRGQTGRPNVIPPF
jgi:hypothetical protein